MISWNKDEGKPSSVAWKRDKNKLKEQKMTKSNSFESHRLISNIIFGWHGFELIIL